MSDTTREAEAVQQELIRRMTPAERLAKSLTLSCDLMRLSKAAIRRRHPTMTEDEVRIKFIELHYGLELAESVRQWRENSKE